MKKVVLITILLVALLGSTGYAQDVEWDISISESFTSVGSGSWSIIDEYGNMIDCGPDEAGCEEQMKLLLREKEEVEKEVTITIQRKYLEDLGAAASMIHSYGERWGLNNSFREECRKAYNALQEAIFVSLRDDFLKPDSE